MIYIKFNIKVPLTFNELKLGYLRVWLLIVIVVYQLLKLNKIELCHRLTRIMYIFFSMLHGQVRA